MITPHMLKVSYLTNYIYLFCLAEVRNLKVSTAQHIYMEDIPFRKKHYRE